MLTREYLANYVYLQEVIEKDKKKLKDVKDNPPTTEVSKVYGSSHLFPYLKKGFFVAEPNVKDSLRWKEKIRLFEFTITEEIKALEQIKFEINELIMTIKNPQHKLVFEYLYIDGMTQQQVADKLYMDRSNVSKIVDKYVK